MKDNSSKEWNLYWSGNRRRFLYDAVAWFYRRFLISRLENFFLKKHFRRGSSLLHAGCGSGESDFLINGYFEITAVDFSELALSNYRKLNPKVKNLILADIRSLPFSDNSFDGIYNLGVLEHYSQEDVVVILKEFRRVLKKKGKIVIFWPPEYGLSVIFFKILRFFVSLVKPKDEIKFHPEELTRIKSKEQVKDILSKANFRLVEFYFGIRDFFTYCVVVAGKN